MIKPIDWEKRVRECNEKSHTWNNEEIRAFLATEDQIGRLTNYGRKDDVIPSQDFTILRFYNSSADWSVIYAMETLKAKKAKTVNLDANEIVVPFKPSIMENIKTCLSTHPLYRLSSEAQWRGETPPFEARLGWVLKQVEKRRHEKMEGIL